MANERRTTPHQILVDQPLPGFYPCLTLQLNVTRYASGRLGRFVLVVREPSAGLEIRRAFSDTTDWAAIAERAEAELMSALKGLAYLQDGENH